MINVVDEHEEFMDELLRKLNGDEQVSDPFKAIVAVENFPIHDDKTNWRMKKPILSEKYVNAKQFMDCLTYYALANGFSLWYHRSSEKEVIAKCGQRPPRLKNPDAGKKRKYNRYPSVGKGDEPKCSWRCFGRKMKTEDSFQVVSLVDEHTCVRSFRFGSLINYKWIGKEFGDKIKANPNIRLVDIADLVLKKYKCSVTPNQCSKAKTWALSEYDKSIQQHYALLRSYGDELLTSNPGSTVKIGVTQNPDGNLLTAIGRYGNNHIYPIAWAVVSVENKDNWTWFFKLLAGDLEINGGVRITLMSDQHKGLIEAVKDVMPYAEHRQCARHIYENFRKKYSCVEFRNLFWAASKASYPVLFDTIMDRNGAANQNAATYLIERNPKSWSSAFFETNRGCEAVENGFSECFNSVILTCRHKSIITMLESIRVIVMERMNVMRRLGQEWVGDIAPNIMRRLEINKDHHSFWTTHFSGGYEFEVRHKSEAFKVDGKMRTCSCRMWQLSGLPCPHACSAIFAMGKSPEDYIPAWFRKDMYIGTYSTYLKPVGGISCWVPNNLNKPLPPQPKKDNIYIKGLIGIITETNRFKRCSWMVLLVNSRNNKTRMSIQQQISGSNCFEYVQGVQWWMKIVEGGFSLWEEVVTEE
ncbi:uncharacterized protein [Rutidosis leptorrhynchoides]|uniref:uncharacterized protein n=1 Tax=Rutidosis leptorrhynchoides TaxID=125765 RepID=UPI003A99656A